MFNRLWSLISTPSTSWSLGGLLVIGLLLGVVSSVAFETTMEMTNTEKFCTESCHEMTDNVAKEFVGTSHDFNNSGVRTTCSDCHVPQPFIPKMIRKVKASLEVYHHLLGTLDTQEKFENHRLRMANNVWREMHGNDSRECRNCHTVEKMAFDQQHQKAAEFHLDAFREGKTCIDCHKGIAHKLPRELIEKARLEQEKELELQKESASPIKNAGGTANNSNIEEGS
jgi:cytochrome c-type protein NapC